MTFVAFPPPPSSRIGLVLSHDDVPFDFQLSRDGLKHPNRHLHRLGRNPGDFLMSCEGDSCRKRSFCIVLSISRTLSLLSLVTCHLSLVTCFVIVIIFVGNVSVESVSYSSLSLSLSLSRVFLKKRAPSSL
jgi:hypothetical protein